MGGAPSSVDCTTVGDGAIVDGCTIAGGCAIVGDCTVAGDCTVTEDWAIAGAAAARCRRMQPQSNTAFPRNGSGRPRHCVAIAVGNRRVAPGCGCLIKKQRFLAANERK